ncbi:MAG: diguanylate cyclase [Candidatus Velthaea sp.]
MHNAAFPAGATILVVDDEPSNVEVLADVLEPDYEVVFATNGAQALSLADTVKPDLILLDVMMPGMDGFEVFRRLKEHAPTADIPVIFLTGLTDSKSETRGLELGAADFVTKPFTAAVVRARVRNNIEFKRARDQITHLAMTDGLTGVANRRRFDMVLDLEYKRLARTGVFLSLILLDIDYFKAFNDTYGHVAGDDCVRKVAGALSASVSRPADLAARYGGDEFACILPDTDLHGATTIAEHVQFRIGELDISHSGSSVSSRVTASVGVLSTLCIPALSSTAVVTAADACLYRAKADGRNRISAGEGDLQLSV